VTGSKPGAPTSDAAAKDFQNLGGIVQTGIERPFRLSFGTGSFTGDLGIE
jgi:hypothetical protein